MPAYYQGTRAEKAAAAAQRRQPMGEEPKTLSVVEAGRQYFDIGRTLSYEAARSGQIPTIRIGKKLRVPVVALEKMLDVPPKKTAGT
jgi:hypothetical protein